MRAKSRYSTRVFRQICTVLAKRRIGRKDASNDTICDINRPLVMPKMNRKLITLPLSVTLRTVTIFKFYVRLRTNQSYRVISVGDMNFEVSIRSRPWKLKNRRNSRVYWRTFTVLAEIRFGKKVASNDIFIHIKWRLVLPEMNLKSIFWLFSSITTCDCEGTNQITL